MYFNFFGLRTKPFNTTPDPDFLYLSPGHKQALGSLIYGIKEKKGFIAVTGQVGLGKTTILRSFLDQPHQPNQETIYLLNPNLSFTSLLKTLLRELGHTPIEGDDAEVLEQLHFVLIEKYREGKTVVLLIDEAQNMPVDTLEHLRMLSNLETPKDKLIQIVLLGQPELDALLDQYELRQLRQRIAVRAIIQPLSKPESFEYIRHRLDKAGGEGKKIFTNSALGLIVQEAKGIPRRLNILCDNALVTAFGYNTALVTAKIAKEVIGDLTGQPAHTLWKLVPLIGLALILVLGLVALLPLTESKFSDFPSINRIGETDTDKENPKQDLVSDQDLLSVDENTPSPTQTVPTLTERAQTFLTQSVSEVFENLRTRAGSNFESITTQASVNPHIDSENQKDLLLAGIPPDNFQREGPPVSDDREVPSTSETVLPGILPLHQEHFDLSTQEDGGVKAEADSPENGARLSHVEMETPSIQSAQQELPELLIQEEGIATAEANSMVEENPVLQDEARIPSENVSEDNLVRLSPENLSERAGQPTLAAEEPLSIPIQDNSPPVPVPHKRGASKESPSKPEVVASSLPVTRIVKKGDTMAKLLHDVYGVSSPSTVQFVLEHNRHITSVRRMYPGQKIMFPPLQSVERKNKLTEADVTLVSVKDEGLPPSKAIFAHSSTQLKPNEVKNEAKRDSPYAVATVQEGDTLEKLIKVIYGSSHPSYVQRVLEYNPNIRNPKKIFPGQDIAFPKIAQDVKTQTDLASEANPAE
ncbi:AAA family ATPase [Candidatus Nitrospira allomarina]|uniref:AAA family ATPase n=1 Tax=Candidatus Nitrospira allomarina TaxID=3020900 RepID=A0AA96GG75_9BACT|nr:AAA family ATPase [Candidatus Nitrospira allomarina]WNM57979.1 AAA family ATPase [Candidatus Nitrospira allomarina]